MGKRGPLAGTPRRGAPTGIRFDPKLKARLDEARTASGRSFSEEVSARLELSFRALEFDDLLTRELVAIVAHSLGIISEREGRPWHETQRSWRLAREAVLEILSFFDPGGEPDVPDDHPFLHELRVRGIDDWFIEETREQLDKELLGNSNLGKMSARFAIANREADAGGIVKRKLEEKGTDGYALPKLQQARDPFWRVSAENIEDARATGDDADKAKGDAHDQ